MNSEEHAGQKKRQPAKRQAENRPARRGIVAETSWGYGNDPQSEQEFFERFEGLCYALMDNKNIFGFCYTQLYDIEQEQNGLLYYNRSPKFEPAKFKAILDRKAKIED